jgi:predicted DNA-binding transcriptional regulator AlpA
MLKVIESPAQARDRRKRHAPVERVILRPRDVELRYDISAPTRWRWERTGKLPPRDVFIGGRPAGWRPATLDAADRCPAS